MTLPSFAITACAIDRALTKARWGSLFDDKHVDAVAQSLAVP